MRLYYGWDLKSWSGSKFDFEARSFFSSDELFYLYLSSEGRINRQRYLIGVILLNTVGMIVGFLFELITPGLSLILLLVTTQPAMGN